MKAKTILTVVALLAMAGCGSKKEQSIEVLISGGNLDHIRARKKELSEAQKNLEHEIALLDSVISAKNENKKLPLVTAFKVQTQNFDHHVELRGDVTTKQNILVYPEASGTLLRVHVTEGQSVTQGQLLATIDDGGMRDQLLQLRTQLALAKTTFERQELLWKQKIGTEIQYLQTKANYETQANKIRQIEGQLSKYTIRAPFSGIIDDVIKDQGNVVIPGGPGTEVFRIVNLSNMYLEVNVPESYINGVTAGKKVMVYFPILNETIESTVRQTGNFINPNNRSFTAEIPVPNKGGRIKPNLTAKVQINDYSNKEAILIPQGIISENAEGEQYTFVLSNVSAENIAYANKNIITTGKTQGDIVEVLTGLENGQMVIQEGARSVKDGQQIKILTQ